MLSSLNVTNFRGFERLEIPKLARVNLIGGVNNSGKTALLEAIFLLVERNQQSITQLPHLFRPASAIDDQRYFWRWLAYDGRPQTQASITANIEGFGHMTALWSPHQQGPTDRASQTLLHVAGRNLIVPALAENQNRQWPTIEIFSPTPTAPIQDAQIYIRAAKKKNGEERIESLLREIEPRLKRIRVYPDEQTNQPLIHVTLSGIGEALPANQLGQGFNRLLRIYCSLLRAEAKVFLVDEVETGLHHTVLPTVWKGLAAVARQENVQIFATTHSREAILAAHRVFSTEPSYDFTYHRLERVAGQVNVVTYDQKRLEGADERNFELR
jgi:AAA15 family ATPase/GTPase